MTAVRYTPGDSQTFSVPGLQTVLVSQCDVLTSHQHGNHLGVPDRIGDRERAFRGVVYGLVLYLSPQIALEGPDLIREIASWLCLV